MNQPNNIRQFSLRDFSTVGTIIISALAAGLVVGGGVYYWQKSVAEDEKMRQ
ncbi:MAG: hypothetical protein ACE5K3_02530 [bacterium]